MANSTQTFDANVMRAEILKSVILTLGQQQYPDDLNVCDINLVAYQKLDSIITDIKRLDSSIRELCPKTITANRQILVTGIWPYAER